MELAYSSPVVPISTQFFRNVLIFFSIRLSFFYHINKSKCYSIILPLIISYDHNSITYKSVVNLWHPTFLSSLYICRHKLNMNLKRWILCVVFNLNRHFQYFKQKYLFDMHISRHRTQESQIDYIRIVYKFKMLWRSIICYSCHFQYDVIKKRTLLKHCRRFDIFVIKLETISHWTMVVSY